MSDVPADVMAALASGQVESVNLMEWLAADMSALAENVAAEMPARVARALRAAALEIRGLGVTVRLQLLGRAIAETTNADGELFERFAAHRSDIVRQWASYAANDPVLDRDFSARLRATERFADDANMSVRETAWIAFRPHLATNLDDALSRLIPYTRSESENIRRFAVEVTRPRSVWGAHIGQLKRNPEIARALLDTVASDESRYVQLAVGNWLNDASKTRPDWVESVCRDWSKRSCKQTDFIIKRGRRTLRRKKGADSAGLLMGVEGVAA